MKNEDERSKNLLIRKYKYYAKGLAFSLCDQYEYAFLLRDDLISIGLEQVLVALKYYDWSSPFYPYWLTIADREMKRHIERSFKHLYSVSLDMEVTDSGQTLHDIVSDDNESDDTISLYDTFMDIANSKKTDLSAIERYVVVHYLLGYSVQEIAKLTNCSRSRIYTHYRNAIQKIRVILVKQK